MKRRYLLIAGCLLGAVSVRLNIHLYRQRHAPPPKETPKEAAITLPEDWRVFEKLATVFEELVESERRAFPAMPEVKFDFSDTAFADDSWKLTDAPSPMNLDKPFDWEDVNPAKPKADPDNLFGVGDPPRKPPVIKESYAGVPAKTDSTTVKPAPASSTK